MSVYDSDTDTITRMSRQLQIIDDEVQESSGPLTNKHRAWCFTINNPVIDLRERLEKLKNKFIYAVFCLEEGASKTPHYQGYIYFRNQVTLKHCKDLVSIRGHFEPARGTVQDNVDYIFHSGRHNSKTGLLEGPWEFGERPKQGKRNDLVRFAENVRRTRKFIDLYKDDENHPVLAKYPQFAQAMYNIKRIEDMPTVDFETMYDWEIKMLALLKERPKQRRIFWIWSEESGTGKSSFGQYVMGREDVLLADGTYKDIIYAYQDQSIIWFDIPRGDSLDPLLMSTLERLSNLGWHMSTKYQSANKYVNAHIVCTSNRPPPVDMLPERFVSIVASKKRAPLTHIEDEWGTEGLSQTVLPDLSQIMQNNTYELGEESDLFCDEYAAEYN